MLFPRKLVRVCGTVDEVERVRGIDKTYGHVENDNGRDESNTQSTNDPARAHETQASGGSFENATNGENATACNNGRPTSNKVGEITGDDGAEKGTEGENGAGQGLIACGQMERFDGSLVTGIRVRKASV